MIEPERLRSLLYYDPATGVFTRKTGMYAGRVAGTPSHHGYIKIWIDGERHYAHRLAWLYVHSEWPVATIDHINVEPADNRIANLRAATQTQNNANMRIPKTNTSGFKGVTFDRANGKWMAQIQINGRRLYLGRFVAAADARAVYCAAAAIHFGKFARTE